MLLPKVTQLILDPGPTSPSPPGSASPTFCISLTQDLSSSSLKGNPAQIWGAHIRNRAGLDPAGAPSLSLPPSVSLPSLDHADSWPCGKMQFSPICPVASPLCMLISSQHLPAIGYSSGFSLGLFFVFIPCVQRQLTWSRSRVWKMREAKELKARS